MLKKMYKHRIEDTENLILREFFQGILSRVQDGVWVTDRNDNVIFANDSMGRIAGLSADKIVGKNVINGFSEETIGEFKKYYLEAKRCLKPVFYDSVPVRTPAGRDTYQTGWITPIVENGEFNGMISTANDVTNIVRTREKLSIAMQCLDSNSLEIFWITPEGRFVYANESACEKLGYTCEELIGMKIHDVNPVRTEDQRKEQWEELKSRGSKVFESRHRKKDGTIYPVEIRGHYLDFNGKELQIAFAEDITERKKAEAALEESENRYKTYIDNAPLGVFLADNHGNYLDVNDLACEITGFSREELLGMNIRDLVMAGEAENGLDHVKTLIETGRAYGEFWFNRKSREKYCMSIDAVKLDEDRFMAFCSDITEKKLAEDERERLQEALLHSQKLEAIGQLAGGVAHDFNNMLGVIMGNANLALNQLAEGDEFYLELKEIMMASERARDLTMKLLTFARKDKLSIKSVRMTEIIRDLESMLNRSLSKKVRVETSVGCDCIIRVDSNQIQQALLNICNNAGDAMPGGGLLSITTRHQILDETFSKINPDIIPGGFCRITIADNGHGMVPDIAKRVFDPFFTTKGKGKGTGLGLSTTLGIIKNHGGHIEMSSVPGEGTVVDIYLPVSVNCEVGEKETRKAEPMKGIGTILAVDDEPGILLLLERILNRAGYSVLKAACGKDALDVFETGRDDIDAVVLDLMMPEMDGEELFAKLLEIKPDVKVILSSGISIDGHAGSIMDKGVCGFVQKPFVISDLLGAVSEILKKQ
ncbi:MAG TPA: PAS domain S-box protein [bacterium]|nr:PAS domain S-box protein [bacterium]